MNLSPRAERLISMQKARYLRSMPDKKVRIRRCWKAVTNGDWNSDAAAMLKTEVHRLSGSAGSYGLQDLGLAARDLDVLLSAHVGIKPVTAEFVSVCNELIGVLFDSIDRVISTLPEPGETSVEKDDI